MSAFIKYPVLDKYLAVLVALTATTSVALGLLWSLQSSALLSG